MDSASKKRTYSGLSNYTEESNSNKKLNMTGETSYHLKMLVPSVAAGAIIGKGGETIAEIQKNVGARVKMSKPNDFYPGTNERVCLITGSTDAISTIVQFFNMKIKEKPDPNAKPAIDFDNKIAAERERQMKVIVPNSTAGMIIGKGGSFIKHLKEQSRAFIQLSQKSKETPLPERVITVIGEDENLKEALNLILQKVVEDPQSGSCLNISYKITNGPVANPNPTGSPFANGDSMGLDKSDDRDTEGYSIPLAGGGTLNLKLNFNPHIQAEDARIMSEYLGHINSSLKMKGYNDKVADEITKAFGALSLHGVLQIDLMLPQLANGLLAEAPVPHPFPIIDALAAMPPPLPPNGHSNQPPPNMLSSVSSQLTSPSNMPPPEPTVITDSLRANMGLPPPPPTPPNQGPFGPSGLIPPGGHSQQPTAELSPNQAMAVAAAAAAAAAELQQQQSPFKRSSNPMQIHPPEFNSMLPPMNNNSFGLATAGNPLPTMSQATQESAAAAAGVAANQFAQQIAAQQQAQAAAAAAVTTIGGGPMGRSGLNSIVATASHHHHAQPQSSALAITGPPQMTSEDSINKIDMEVNESIVGAVIGQGGKSIVEIQQYSGTNIQISKKGNYSPGTRNRVVTITGPQKCLGAAQYLINQRVAEEELKRQHNAAGQHINIGF